jgi:acyl-CoA synthetase (AMP-forming)/AMP-acid ligase II
MKHPLPIDSVSTILACLDHYAENRPEAPACTYLIDGANETVTINYKTLRAESLRLAGWMVEKGYRGHAVVLMFPSGIEFVTAFFACLYAGAYAVPANVPRKAPHFERIQQIIRDSRSVAVLTSDGLVTMIYAGMQAAGQLLPVYSRSMVPQGDFESLVRSVSPDGIAFLQYTSGSTGTPKGVIVTHNNLIANERAIRSNANLSEGQICCAWLPQFHDMGLIGTTLQPLAMGGHAVLMSPLHFIQRPMRWLRAISQYSGMVSATPNFGLELCTKATWTPEDEALDLSSLETIFCGAEPVRKETVEAFISRFEPLGLRPDAVKPCYGMAETTLIVSGLAGAGARSHYIPVDAAKLATREIEVQPGSNMEITSCGTVVKGHEVRIVDPDTKTALAGNRVGEIWVSGPSVASGYWRNDELSLEVFQARTIAGEGPFCRTGDLGFLWDNNLYITGRIKDLIIVRGRNIYPHDIEQSLVEALRDRMDVTAAVFSLEQTNGLKVGAFIELPRSANEEDKKQVESLIPKLKQDIIALHEIELTRLSIVFYGAIPKTSSGKIQRSKCGELMNAEKLMIQAVFETA